MKYALKNYAKKSAKIDESELLYWSFTNEDDDEFKGPDALEYAELTHKERLMKLAVEHKGAATIFDPSNLLSDKSKSTYKPSTYQEVIRAIFSLIK